MAEDLQKLDEWFGRILRGLSPSERIAAARKLGMGLRKSNTARIAKNVEPEGDPMARRKARYDRLGKLRQKAGALMFRGLRKPEHWKVDATADGVEIRPANGLIDRIASNNQFGEVVTVGRLRNRRRIRAKYPDRHLLGFAPDDERLAIDIAADMLDPDR